VNHHPLVNVCCCCQSHRVAWSRDVRPISQHRFHPHNMRPTNYSHTRSLIPRIRSHTHTHTHARPTALPGPLYVRRRWERRVVAGAVVRRGVVLRRTATVDDRRPRRARSPEHRFHPRNLRPTNNPVVDITPRPRPLPLVIRHFE